MGMVVAKEFRVRPNEVFGEWESLEVLITFGTLMNDISKENWTSHKIATQPQYKLPAPESKYAVAFKTLTMLQHENEKAIKENQFG